MRGPSRSALPLAATVLLVLIAGVVTVGAGEVAPPNVETTFSDTVDVIKDDVVSTAEVAVRLTEATPALQGVPRTVVARDDVFADSMSSGVLQGDSPLLLVPTVGPLPDRVVEALMTVGSTEVLLLGGTAAISPEVEAQIAALGLSTDRRAGPDRVATAVEIARADAPDAQTAILTRAFGASATDPSQAFADSLAVGGWSAETGWPVLLTDTAGLSQATADYLAESAITRVEIVGGTAAVSAAVEGDLVAMGMTVDRTSGSNRFATAVEVAGKRGASSAADVDRVTVVEGQAADAWAGGFAAAGHSAAFDAPIVLSNGDVVPPETAAFLGGATFAKRMGTRGLTDEAAALTCVTRGSAVCGAARTDLGLPSAVVTVTPAGGPIEEGTSILVAVQATAPFTAVVDGTCVDTPVAPPTTGVSVSVPLVTTTDHPCTLEVVATFADGTVQQTAITYDDSFIPPAEEPTPTPTPTPTGPAGPTGPTGPTTGPPTGPVVTTGVLDVRVVSATTGEPLEGATVDITGPIGGAQPAGITGVTDAEGIASFELDPGGYVATGRAPGFDDDVSEPVEVTAGEVAMTTLTLSPDITGGELRIVLTWAAQPTDLDSHLWLPEEVPYEVFFPLGHRGSLEQCPFAALDVDDIDSFGPETITISQPFDGVYTYAVFNFSNDAPLTVSEAVVEVYDDAGLMDRFAVPTDGPTEARWWHVVDIDGASGQIDAGQGLQVDSPGLYGSTTEGCAAG